MNITDRKHNRILAAALLLLVCVLLTSCMGNVRKEKALRDQALGFMDKGDYSAAVAFFDDALALSNGKVGELELDMLRYRAECEIILEDYEAAAHTYGLLLQEDGERPEYMNLRTICLVRAGGDLEEALELYRKADGADSRSAGHAQALYALGTALARSGEADLEKAAREIYLDAIEDEELRSGELYNRMGMIYFFSGDYETAIRYFDAGIGFVDRSPAGGEEDVRRSLMYNIAICYEYLQDYSEAYERFLAYEEAYGADGDLKHEMDYLKSRVRR